MVSYSLGFDMRSPDFATPTVELYQAALDLAEYADAHGVDQVNVQEHHQSPDGYLPAPFVLGAALAARTKKCDLMLGVVLLPLHDPVKIAEQIAVLDLISNGRLQVTFGTGYVPHEFAAFNVSMHDRARLMDEGLEIIQRALSGERFQFGGREIFVRPLPAQKPVQLFVGGGVPASARRAARFGMGFWPLNPAMIPIYDEECRKLGREPGHAIGRDSAGGGWVFVAEDVEAVWAQIKPNVDAAAKLYSEWGQDTAKSSSPFKTLNTGDLWRQSGFFRILTPEQCITEGKAGGSFGLVPLIGGCSPKLGWDSTKLFVEKVLPAIRP